MSEFEKWYWENDGTSVDQFYGLGYYETGVKTAFAAGQAAEREACADLCEQLVGIGHQSVNDAYKTSADAIRARGNSVS